MTTTHFQEEKTRLVLDRDMLKALTDAVAEQAENLEINMSYAYQAFNDKADYEQIATLRDLRRLYQLLERRLLASSRTCRPKLTLSLPVSYVYLLHQQILFSFGNHWLQLAINEIDQTIKSYRLSNLLQLRK